MQRRLAMMVLCLGLALVAAPAIAAPAKEAAAQPRHTYDEVKAFVESAVAHLKKVGPQKAFADFNASSGPWIKDELYIFVFDQKGLYMATGYRPERTGTEAWKMKDASGTRLVVQDIIKKAKRDGTASIDYLWQNPSSGKLENKTSYVVQVDEYVVGAGFYHK